MQLKTMTRNKGSVIYSALYNADSDEAQHEERKVTCKEAPLPELDKALQGLTSVVQDVMEVTKEWVKGVTVVGFSILRTKNGTQSIKVTYDRPFAVMGEEDSDTLRMTSPAARIQKAADGDDEKPVLKKSLITIVNRVIKHSEDYASGKRQQMLLDMPDPNTDEPEDEEASLI